MLTRSILRDKPMHTVARYNGGHKKYVDVPQPHVVNQNNKYMFGVDRFNQNNNHLRIAVDGKKWYWPIVTRLVDTGMHNAWQLHKKSGAPRPCCVQEGACLHHPPRGSSNSSRNSSTGLFGSRPGDMDIRYNCVAHYIKKHAQRRHCAMEGCDVKCVTYCGKRDRAVCMEDFEQYHSRS